MAGGTWWETENLKKRPNSIEGIFLTFYENSGKILETKVSKSDCDDDDHRGKSLLLRGDSTMLSPKVAVCATLQSELETPPELQIAAQNLYRPRTARICIKYGTA